MHRKTDDREARILTERARRLAEEKENGHSPEDDLELLEFRIAGETYGIELKYIREVYTVKEFTFLPGIPRFIRGIINVRGSIVSVVDLGQFFGLPETAPDKNCPAIILSSDDMEFGVLTEGITGVRNLPRTDVQNPVPTLSGIRARYLKGIIDGTTALLDGKKLLEDRQMRIYQEPELQ